MRVTLWREARRKRNSNAKLDKRYSVLLSIAFTSKRDILDARGVSLARDYARTLSCIFWYSKPYTPLALTTTSLVRRKTEEKLIQSFPYLETSLIRPTRWPDYIFMTHRRSYELGSTLFTLQDSFRLHSSFIVLLPRVRERVQSADKRHMYM